MSTTELKFQKHGCRRSNNTTTDQYHNGSLRKQRLQSEQWGSKCTNHQQSRYYLDWCTASRHHRLMADQQYSGRNVTIHITVTRSWDKRLTQLWFQTTMNNIFQDNKCIAFTAPFNNMRTLKFKAQPTNAFFRCRQSNVRRVLPASDYCRGLFVSWSFLQSSTKSSVPP